MKDIYDIVCILIVIMGVLELLYAIFISVYHKNPKKWDFYVQVYKDKWLHHACHRCCLTCKWRYECWSEFKWYLESEEDDDN